MIQMKQVQKHKILLEIKTFLSEFLFNKVTNLNLINPFHATGFFLYPLKTSENQRFSNVFRGYRKRTMARNGSKNIQKPNVFFSFFFI